MNEEKIYALLTAWRLEEARAKDEEKVLSYQLKPPFDDLLESRSVLFGRVEAIELEPLVKSILKNWDYRKFDTNLLQNHNVQVVMGDSFIY